MKNGKIGKLIIFNLFFIVFLFYIAEIYAYRCLFCTDFGIFPNYKIFEKLKDEFIVGNHLYVNYEKPKKGNPIYYVNDGRELTGGEYKKNPVILLGDSYTYGLGLNKEETFGTQLSKYTKRPVYTWGFCTEGMEYSVLELKNNKNTEKLLSEKNPVDYVIYTYTYIQPLRIINRQRRYRFYYLRQYDLLNGQKYSVFDNLFSFLLLKNTLFVKSLYKGSYDDNVLLLMKNYLKEMNKDVKKMFPNAKFIFLIYSDDIDMIKNMNKFYDENTNRFLDTKYWKDLENDGITVLSTEELTGRKMFDEDIIKKDPTRTIHPTEEAWRDIVVKLTEKLNF